MTLNKMSAPRAVTFCLETNWSPEETSCLLLQNCASFSQLSSQVPNLGGEQAMGHEWDPGVPSKVLHNTGSSGPVMANVGAGE